MRGITAGVPVLRLLRAGSNDLIYIFLSNRVYPDGTTNKLAGLGIRSRIQDTIYRSLGVGTR